MPEWLYTLRERLTANPQKRFDDYRAFSGFHHITELVTLDSMMCPDLIDELRTEDWEHNVLADFRTELFRDADYLIPESSTDDSAYQSDNSDSTDSALVVVSLLCRATSRRSVTATLGPPLEPWRFGIRNGS